MKQLIQFLKKMGLPLLLLLILVLPLFWGKFIPVTAKAFLYSLSLSMKAILLVILPFIIFSFVFSAIMNLKSGVFKFILTLIAMIFLSNSAAIFTGFTVGSIILPKLSIAAHTPPDAQMLLTPLWTLKLKNWIPNQYALIAGFILGIIFSFWKMAIADKTAKNLNKLANAFLKIVFIPLLPLFILGFVFKLEHDQLLAKALRTFGPVFFVVVGTQITYLLVLYFCAAKGSIKTFFDYIKNILPATITGFSTLSSAASMPVLILCTEKNLSEPAIAEMVIPATINTHTIGSAIGITLLSLTTLLAFGHALPTFYEFFEFGFIYALAKFAVAAVPGGAIIVVTPLLESYFHFTGEMVGLITAIYMLFDPFGTATNVTGNGFFPIAFSRIFDFKLTKN
ncbi:MAG: cation:dicarboxylase symporter family transporter [Candidatus Berkiella sp.]